MPAMPAGVSWPGPGHLANLWPTSLRRDRPNEPLVSCRRNGVRAYAELMQEPPRSVRQVDVAGSCSLSIGTDPLDLNPARSPGPLGRGESGVD